MLNVRFCTILLLLGVTFVFGEQLTFAVVAPGATSAKVIINGNEYLMTTTPYPEVPYFLTTVDGLTNNGQLTYHYSVDGVAETFDRVFPSLRINTYNDFFGRQDTLKSLPQLGWPFTQKQQWNRNSGPKGVFDDDYISTVIFTGGEQVNFFFRNITAKAKVTGMKVAMINKDSAAYWTDVELNIEDTTQLKPNMKIEIVGNYKSRSDFKLRPSVADPVFIRDKLYNDLLQSVGCPHQESSFTRVYVNQYGLGLYNLQEKVGTKDFIKTQFYGKNVPKPDPLGTPLECTTGADFATDVNLGAFQPPKNASNENIVKLINALAALDTSSDAAMADFDLKWFSIDHFFRAMALEYLAGHYDSYWFMTTNFVVYDDPTESTATTKKYYFIDQDFDQTFGVNLSPIYNPYGENYTRIPYTNYVNKEWTVVPYDAPRRTMIDKLLANPTYRAKFEDTLKTIVRGVYNPIALNRRIDALIERIRPDMEWDLSLGINRAHQGNPVFAEFMVVWTLDDFNNGLTTTLRGNWGLKNFISERANFVAESFGIEFINPPLEPGNPSTSTTNNGASTGASSTASASTGAGGASTTISSSTTATGEDESANSSSQITLSFFLLFIIMFISS